MSDDLSVVANLVANWNGVIMPLSEVKVSVLDRAFLFGDAVYEVIKVYDGRLFRLSDHMDRLQKSLQSLEIAHVDVGVVQTRLKATVSESRLKHALAYIQITRGEAVRTHHYPQSYVPNQLIYVSPFDDPYAAVRETGVKAVTHPDIRWGRNDIKATSLAANCIASQFARQKGAMEVVFIDKGGYMTEGSHTSLFGLKDGKLLVAPSSANVLPGITKRQILELAEDIELPVLETRIREDDIFQLDELFLAGTPEELIAIVTVDDKQIGDGKPGPIVRQLHAAFREGIEAHLQ